MESPMKHCIASIWHSLPLYNVLIEVRKFSCGLTIPTFHSFELTSSLQQHNTVILEINLLVK